MKRRRHYHRRARANPLTHKKIVTYAVVGGLTALGVGLLWHFSKTAQAAQLPPGGSPSSNQNPPLVVSYTQLVPGNSGLTVKANSQIIVKMPGPPGSLAAGGPSGVWVDKSTGSVKLQGQTFASDGVTWQMVFGVSAPGPGVLAMQSVLAISNPALGGEVYAANVTVS